MCLEGYKLKYWGCVCLFFAVFQIKLRKTSLGTVISNFAPKIGNTLEIPIHPRRKFPISHVLK